jgi:hypothetical protein
MSHDYYEGDCQFPANAQVSHPSLLNVSWDETGYIMSKLTLFVKLNICKK